MKFFYNTGYKNPKLQIEDDCVCRAVSIILNKHYASVAVSIDDMCSKTKTRSNWQAKQPCNHAKGVRTYTANKFLRSQGFEYISLVVNNKVTTKVKDLPYGYIIARTTNHVAAVINRVLHDTEDIRDHFTYGFWARGIIRTTYTTKLETHSEDSLLWFAKAMCQVNNDIYLHHRLIVNGKLLILSVAR